MNSNWDLGPNAERNVGRIPVNANEFVASIDANMDAEMRWVDSTSGRVIVGTSDAQLGTSGGIYTDSSGQEMVVTYSDDGNTIRITSPTATVATAIIVQAGPSGAQGTVTSLLERRLTMRDQQYASKFQVPCQQPHHQANLLRHQRIRQQIRN
eukprot:TRINITY_DN156_c0_g1_i5.p1 TRINITY_DN156_c0_g1~~TRINITY_DN156_c0_g1_i5.p1  ORF type:complete len:173 (+),score=23.97 TRINITY_DN156_c0_g1_i5:62-520(+)